MTDIVMTLIEELRELWPGLGVSANVGDTEKTDVEVTVQRWIQRIEGAEVHLNLTYCPGDSESKMDQIMNWLQDLKGLIHDKDPKNPLLQWWLGDVGFKATPLSVTCDVVLRLGLEDA